MKNITMNNGFHDDYCEVCLLEMDCCGNCREIGMCYRSRSGKNASIVHAPH
jgi:hypothetical protein